MHKYFLTQIIKSTDTTLNRIIDAVVDKPDQYRYYTVNRESFY